MMYSISSLRLSSRLSGCRLVSPVVVSSLRLSSRLDSRCGVHSSIAVCPSCATHRQGRLIQPCCEWQLLPQEPPLVEYSISRSPESTTVHHIPKLSHRTCWIPRALSFERIRQMVVLQSPPPPTTAIGRPMDFFGSSCQPMSFSGIPQNTRCTIRCNA